MDGGSSASSSTASTEGTFRKWRTSGEGVLDVAVSPLLHMKRTIRMQRATNIATRAMFWKLTLCFGGGSDAPASAFLRHTGEGEDGEGRGREGEGSDDSCMHSNSWGGTLLRMSLKRSLNASVITLSYN